MNEVKITPIEIGDGVGFRGAVSISDEELKNRVDFLEQHTKEFSKLVIKAENELYIRELLQRNENLQQELDQYKNNWEQLKIYIEENKINISLRPYSKYAITIEEVLNKMKELKGNEND